MTTKDEALKQALDALKLGAAMYSPAGTAHAQIAAAAIIACRAALAQKDEQKPAAWMLECPTMTGRTGWILSWSRSGAGLCDRLQGEEHEKPLYTAPPTRKPLTNEEIRKIVHGTVENVTVSEAVLFHSVARAIEAHHGI